jgi:hypothetical protein
MVIMVQAAGIAGAKPQGRHMIVVFLCRGKIFPLQTQVRIAFVLCFDRVFMMTNQLTITLTACPQVAPVSGTFFVSLSL